MLSFHQPTIDDLGWIKKITDKMQPLSCDYAVGNILGWHEYYNEKLGNIDGCLVSKRIGENLFTFPQGDNFISALRLIDENYEAPSFYHLSKSECEQLEELFPGKYMFVESRDSFDYVYSVEDLATLSGKKHHQKRNHISYFEKNNNWSYEEITPDTLNECIKMNEEWYCENIEKDPYGIEMERIVLKFAFENYDLLNYRGGLLRSDGKIIAFTFGEKLSDITFNTHFEKAFSSIRGAYQMINRQFALNTISDFKYVNREDDMGLEGLRKSKLSYYPEFLVEKFTAVRL